MKAERINKDQIRFMLGKKDLQERQLDVGELTYGSDKTKELFEDMMHTARDEFGFDAAGKPLMIEAIPISEDSLMITVTKVSGAGEMGMLFGSNIPDGRPAEEAAGPSDKGVTAGVKETSLPEQPVIYVFDTFDLLCRAAQQVNPAITLKNSLYREEEGPYYLVVHYKKLDRQTKYLMTMLPEFYSDVMDAAYGELLVKEHCRCIIRARALQKLAAMENS